MKLWGWGALMLLAVAVAGCGGNSTPVAVTVVPNPATVLLSSQTQFSADVSGASATTVYWQVCLPAGTTGTGSPPPVITKPTNCTPIPGITSSGTTSLSGYGTITQNQGTTGGGLYTAPSVLPSPPTAVILATSTVNTNAFAVSDITIETGVTVQISPTTPITLAPNESYQFTATVTGSTNKAVTWSLSTTATGNPPLGTITTSGFYTAPSTSASVIITATSSADPTQMATITVSVTSGGAPTLTSLSPQVAAQGSVQQDVYLNGSNFDNDSQVIVTAPNLPAATLPPSSVFFITPELIRATVPGNLLATAGLVNIEVESGTIPPNLSGTSSLNVFPVRPALIAAAPDSVSQSGSNTSVILTGGFFSNTTNGTTAMFDGQPVGATFDSSRQLSITVPAGGLSAPGLHSVVVQNSGVAAGEPFMSALNVAVTPTTNFIPTAPTTTIAVGTGPSAVAIDEADGIAVVANTGSNNVTLVSLVGNPPVTINVGTQPTGVAVDDLLPDHLALVVNSGSNSISVIDLSLATPAVTQTLSLAQYIPELIPTGTVPYSIGINPLTHRAFVANRSSSVGTVIDLVNPNPSLQPTPCTTPPCPVTTIGGSPGAYSGTGQNPAVAIDPRLNWAIVTPGGAGSVNIVDLGLPASAGEPNGRSPQSIGNLTLSQTIQGVGVNPETHQAFLTDPHLGTLTTFSFLDNSATDVSLPSNVGGGLVDEAGFEAAAVDGLENIGIAVNTLNGTADIVDLGNNIVLQTVNGVGNSPEAVAIDPATNQAVIANEADNTVSIVSLTDPTTDPIRPLQIVEASPAIAFTSTSPLALTITGSGFNGTSRVLLDGTAITPSSVSANGRQLVVTIPTLLTVSTSPFAQIDPLGSARRFIVQVQNGAGGPVSNATDLAVIQAVSVGNTPVGVAVDTDRDLAVTTNSGSGTASLVSLAAPSAESPESLAPVGLFGPAITVGTTPEGVAVIPRLGLAVVGNNGSNNVSLIDEVTDALQQTTDANSSCAAGGSACGQAGVAIDQDTAVPVIANSTTNTVSLATLTAPGTSTGNWTIALSTTLAVDQDPVAVAVDPNLSYAAVATASQTSSVELLDLLTFATAGRISGSGIQNPSGLVFDPVNQVFLTANSLLNNVVIIDPATFIQTAIGVGIAPTSIDYDYQTSTLVTVNSPSRTVSVINYVCPPSSSAPSSCVGTSVRTVLGLGGTVTSPLVLGANAIALDPKLNLAVLVDPDNNRVLLVPLPY